MIRGAGLAAALLGARLGRDSDSQAASSAALWLGGWAYMLRNAAGVAGRTQTICALLALSAVRRSGGLYNFVTTLDTNGLNAVLPKNRDLTMQNVVGVQMLGWGLGLLFAPEWLTSNIMGGKVGPTILLQGLAINNLVLGGKVFGLCGNQPVCRVPVRNRHRHAIEQVSRRWRRWRRGESGRTRRKFDFHTGDGWQRERCAQQRAPLLRRLGRHLGRRAQRGPHVGPVRRAVPRLERRVRRLLGARLIGRDDAVRAAPKLAGTDRPLPHTWTGRHHPPPV